MCYIFCSRSLYLHIFGFILVNKYLTYCWIKIQLRNNKKWTTLIFHSYLRMYTKTLVLLLLCVVTFRDQPQGSQSCPAFTKTGIVQKTLAPCTSLVTQVSFGLRFIFVPVNPIPPPPPPNHNRFVLGVVIRFCCQHHLHLGHANTRA